MPRPRHEKLLEPFRLKHLTLKNRMVKAPYSSTGADKAGYVLDSAKYHYEAVAKGGVGLFITESVAIDPLGVSGSPRMAIWDDSFIPGQKELAEVVHRHGAPILMQIHHAGPSYSTTTLGHWRTGSTEEAQPLAASALTREQLPGPRRNLPRQVTLVEIQELVGKFTRAAERASEAGFDGVELHFATGFLVNSFFSRAWNKRTDAYGGSVENRARIGAEIARSIRKSLGDRFIIGARINSIEYGARFGDGLTLDETSEICRILEKAGVDLIHSTVYGYNAQEWVLFPEQALFPETPENMKEFARAVRRGDPLIPGALAAKKAVSIPVIAVGKLDFDSAEKVLRDGKADLVAFGRALIADPEAPNKVRQGLADEIRPCTHCMTCLDALGRAVHERCRVNASFGKERELAFVAAKRKKRVLVIGGGPAGMEAARVAALRGHSVALYERSRRLGGLVPLASVIKGTDVEDLPGFITYLKRQMEKLGVRVSLGHAVDEQLVRQIKPDAVIVAAGSRTVAPEIAGIHRSIVVTTSALQAQVELPMRLFGGYLVEQATKVWLPIGKRVVLIGGLMQGTELAEFLVKRGRQVVMTEPSEQLGTGLLEVHRTRLLEWLREKGCTTMASVKYEEITDSGVALLTQDGVRQHLEADSVIVLPVRQADLSWAASLQAPGREVHIVGDCSQPGMIVDAVEAGHRAACAI